MYIYIYVCIYTYILYRKIWERIEHMENYGKYKKIEEYIFDYISTADSLRSIASV